MSAPIVTKGQGVSSSETAIGISGSKEMSNGRADMSLVGMFFFSISTFVFCPMYPAVANGAF